MNCESAWIANRNVQRLVALAVGGMLSWSAHGQAVVDPATQPFHTLAPYVLESSNLEPRIGNEAGGTFAYRPWFENGSWTGDLIQYSVDKDGRRSFTGGTIGLYPREGVATWNAMDELWSARYVFPDYQPYDLASEFTGGWQCVDADPDYWTERNIFTLDETGAQVDFLWTGLDENQQAVLDPPKFNEQNQAGGEPDPYASDILNYVRGDRSQELCKESGTFRWRFSVLGAIVNSRPVYVPAGTSGLVVVGANDGMLHGFQAGPRSTGGGTELWGYVPSMLLDRVGLLRVSPYRPRYFVDGELRSANIGTINSPRHIVAGGLGAGGKGVFVLDVTTPASPTVALELSGEQGAHVGGDYSADIGHVHGRPTIAKLPDGNWYAVFGNGYGSASGDAKLILVPINANGSTGTPVALATTEFDPAANGLSAPALVDVTGNGEADYAYAGDLHGNLWKFNLDTRVAPTRLFRTGASDSDHSRPITVEPDVARHPDNAPGYMVYFGTGSLLSSADAQDDTRQWVYGIWDRGDGFLVNTGRLVEQTLVTAEVTWQIPQEVHSCPAAPTLTENRSYVRFAAVPDPSNPIYPDWTKTTPDLGWKVQLPRDGERLLGRPQVRAERLQFITTNPYDMATAALKAQPDSGSWVLQLDLGSGANAAPKARPLYDLNENCVLDALDGLPAGQVLTDVPEGTYPVGVHIGPFNVAQPAFARVAFDPALGSVVDGVYINALSLPDVEPPIEQVLHGPIDVMTDSPNGPDHRDPTYTITIEGVETTFDAPEALKAPFTSLQFPEASGPTKAFLRADGLGYRVDGHSFAYNKHHGVNYVDLFTLEPRRGQFGGLEPEPANNYRLDIGATYYDPTSLTDPFPMIPPQTPTARELNRVSEIITDGSQKFVVVMANADRSRENVIQIGCNIWPVYDYQTQVMENLRSADPMAAMVADKLVFSLDSIKAAGTCSGGGAYAKYLSSRPTIRITPTERVGTYNATVGTLPGCVNNTDYYVAPTNEVQLTRKDGLDANGNIIAGTEADLYATDPHTTEAFDPQGQNDPEWSGYRWRNGALTIQLLAVTPENDADFVLQDSDHLPVGQGQEGIDLGFGGAYAKAFTVEPSGKVVPLASGVNNGMLYEMSMFWHWGDLARFQTQGKGNPVIPVCLGTVDYQPSLMFESEWLTPGSYGKLTADLDGNEERQREYLELVALAQSGDEQALLNLYQMFVEFPSIAEYHRMRHYVPNSKQLNESHLIAIDKGELDIDLAVDGTPAPVVDIEADLLPSLGPNYRPGRRSWIDLTQQ